MTQKAERIWRHGRLVTLADTSDLLHIIEDGAVAMSQGKIVAVGTTDEVMSQWHSNEVVDVKGQLITPGLIDCHTHLVYAGNRANEFEARLDGASYADIAAAGGGILSSLKATRNATEQELLEQTLPRLDALLSEGVTTVEVKSGYGQNTDSELKQLRVARQLAEVRNVAVSPTLLAAHVVPPEYKVKPDEYVQYVCDTLIPAALADGHIDALDAFCEHIAFSVSQTDKIFARAAASGLKVKLHAAQLSDDGSVALAASHKALSADHLEFADEAAVQALADSGTVAVLLPGAFYCLRETQKPPVALLRKHKVPMAVATDANPGTSPLTSPLLTMNMACVLFGLTVSEAFAGMTREAAKALGRESEIGTIEVGKWCDLAIWRAASPAELIYQLGLHPLTCRVHKGKEDE